MNAADLNPYDLAPPQWARWCLRASALGLGLLLVWAHYAQIDQVTRAPAQIIAKARTQLIQASEGGVLEKLYVKEGDAVKKGQKLAMLQRQRVQAAVNDSQGKVAALRISLARLSAEAYERPLNFSADLLPFNAYIQNQTDLYTQRQKALKQELSALGEHLRLAQDEYALHEPLLKTGDVSQAEILRLKRQVSELQSQMTNRRNKYFQDVQAEMTKVQEELNTQQESLSDRRQLLEHTVLVAPTSGIVKNIKLSTEGGVLRSGEELMHLLPTDSELIVEAKLKPVDVAFVKTGMPALIKLDAYDASIHGAMRGQISYISADTLSEDTRQGELIYYRVQARITAKEFKGAQADKIDIRAGLTATLEIPTGKRSVLSYLTKPISKNFSQALTER